MVSNLNLTVVSFSYRNRIPPYPAPHHGGFVFDCRAVPNPGREEKYKPFCGQDDCVIEYLEATKEAAQFWSHVSALVELSVDTYLARGFTDLAVAFGCTGGQHRSVYFAEKLKSQYAGRSEIVVTLEHLNLANALPDRKP